MQMLERGSFTVGTVSRNQPIGSRVGTKQTVWSVATEVIKSGSGTPIWRFIERNLQENPAMSIFNFTDIIAGISIAGTTMSISDVIATIEQERTVSPDGENLIKLIYKSKCGLETRQLFSAIYSTCDKIGISYQDSNGQFFIQDLVLAEN